MGPGGSETQTLVRGGLSNYSDIDSFEQPIGRFVSLYAGAGGLDIGFALAGFEPVWVSELDPAAMRTHHGVFDLLAKERPHLADIAYESHVGDILAVPEDSLPDRGTADLVIGGPPCQGFSVAGKMDPHDERSKHVFHFMDVVERVQPRAFLLENVKALYANRRWAPIREALVERARGLGYETLMTLVNAADFGVPQARERMFLIGVKSGEGRPEELLTTTAQERPTVRSALAQLPPYGRPGNDLLCVAKITAAKSPVLRRSPFAGMLFNGAGRPLNLDAPSVTLAASMGGNKTPIIDQRALESGSPDSWVVDYHSTLWSDRASAVADSVPDHLRRLTVQEAAALQTFPLGMRWEGPQSAKFRQIGNAVPPRLALAAAQAIKRSLGID